MLLSRRRTVEQRIKYNMLRLRVRQLLSQLHRQHVAGVKTRAETIERRVVETSSFAMNLFRGQIRPEEVFPFRDVLTEEQHHTLKSLVGPVEEFLIDHNDPLKNDEIRELDEPTMDGLKMMGAFGLQVPEKYGGIGLNNTQYGRLVEIVGANDLGLGIVLGAHQSIGFKGILLCGTEEQKQKYLPFAASGEMMAAFCLTEPSSGSDASSIKSRAILSEDGTHYILNGGKIWISNGGIAEIFTVFAQTPVLDKDSGVTKDKVSAFIVERSFGGVTSGPPEKKMGLNASNTAEVHFDDVKIPRENLLGVEGGGFKVAMSILNNGRFGMAAALSGTMKASIQKAVEHATSRIQFGSCIASYGTIQEKLARMAMAQYITESMAYMISSNMDSGAAEYQVEAAISKVYGSEAAWFVTDEAIQILGGMGYMRATGLEKVLRDLRIFRIFEGTNDILRLFVALTGIQYAGGHLKEVQRAFKRPTANLGLILEEGSKRARRFVGMSGGGESLHAYVHPELVDCAKAVSESIEEFGAAVETLLIRYGTSVVDEQFMLNRLANAAIDIYAMVVVLSRASRSLEQNLVSARHESMLTKVICDEGCERVDHLLNCLQKDGRHKKRFEFMSLISKDVVGNGGTVPSHPLGF